MKRIGIRYVAILGLLVSSCPAWASEEGGKKILPQLDVTLFPSLLFWGVVSFLAVFTIVSTVGLPGIKKTMYKRQRLLDADLESAREASEEAAAVMKAYEDDLHDARRKAQDTVGGIVAAANAEANAQREKQEQELKHRLIVAQQNIAEAKNEALKDSHQFVNDLVQDIVSKVMQTGMVQSGKARS